MKARKKKRMIYILVALLIGIVLVVGVLVFANWKIPHDTKDYVYDSAKDLPYQKAALVLGTAKNIGNRPNLYFTYRMQAAKELYDSGKVKVFVLSGDNSRKDYNEPEDMRQALIGMGVPDSIIYLDYAGFRTLDSVVRMNEIFGQSSFIVVSQEFHNERAIFLAQYYDLEAYGYNAKDVEMIRSSFKTKVREYFARVKVFVDMVSGKQPKYLGEPVIIE